jgi:hypothetical protein
MSISRRFLGAAPLTTSHTGYLAHEKQPPYLGPPYDSRYSPTVGFWGGGVSYERGIPVGHTTSHYKCNIHPWFENGDLSCMVKSELRLDPAGNVH